MEFALLAAVSYGISYTIYSWSAERASFAYIMFYGSIYCTIMTAPFALKEKFNPEVLKAIAIERSVWLVASIFIYLSIKKIGVAATATFESVYPFFVALFAALIYKEKPPLSLLIGGAFIFTGISIIAYTKK
jgi:drug/metabolite transporter (DMT)-like permease